MILPPSLVTNNCVAASSVGDFQLTSSRSGTLAAETSILTSLGLYGTCHVTVWHFM